MTLTKYAAIRERPVSRLSTQDVWRAAAYERARRETAERLRGRMENVLDRPKVCVQAGTRLAGAASTAHQAPEIGARPSSALAYDLNSPTSWPICARLRGGFRAAIRDPDGFPFWRVLGATWSRSIWTRRFGIIPAMRM
jgi:hypothetical protein